ncbi:MAG: ComEC/Rec2 family competence protein [Eubacteriales bacterium]|nr:ComEC/Rec2 family competence protein [Eubacteriales bacterium]
MTSRAFHIQRPLATCAVFYGAGVLAGGVWLGFSWLLPAIGLICGLAAAILLRKSAGLRILSTAAAFFFLGVWLSGLAVNPALPPEGKYLVTGRVAGEAVLRETDGRVTARLDDVAVSDETGSYQAMSAYWTYYPGEDAIMPKDGQTAYFEGTLYHPSPQQNPYGFDFKAFLLQKGITVGISGARELAFGPAIQAEHQSPWLRARVYLAERFDSFLGGHAGLAKALIIGDRDGLSEETTTNFRDAGAAHVLAVSGLHVSLMASMAYFVLRRFSLSHRALFVVFAVLLLAYCRLLDFTPSIVRASILTLVYLLGRAMRRRVDPLTSLAAAFLLILLARPLDLFNLGFQLSFLAVLGLVTLGDSLMALYRRWAKRRRLPAFAEKLASAYAATFSASAFTALPVVASFHSFSLVGLIISPLAIAGVGVLMGVYLAGLLLSIIYLPLAQALAWPVIQFTLLYEGLMAWAAGLPLATARAASPAWWQMLIVMGLLALGTRYVMMKARGRAIAALGLVALLILLPLVPQPDPVRYIQLSAGTADSAVILDGEHTVVIDTGEHGGDLANLILSTGRRIDSLIITHLHADHAGGLEQLLKQGVLIGEILLASGAMEAEVADASLNWALTARDSGIPVRTLGAGDEILLGRVKGQVLWPYHGAAYPGLPANANSLVTLWDLDGVSLLSTGDISASYSHYLDIGAQILKVPHHGSRIDATEALIRRVNPEIAFITASGTQPDRYQAAARRLLDSESTYCITGETGAVTITCENGQAHLTGHLQGGTIHGL